VIEEQPTSPQRKPTVEDEVKEADKMSPAPEPPAKSVWESFNIDTRISDKLKKQPMNGED
jgi:hypothetical protein